MKPLQQENLDDLIPKVYDLITETKISIGFNTDERRFGDMTFNQVQDAFRIGVRFGKDEPFLNIRTFYKWTYAHKKVIDDATYQTETLKEKNVPYYQEPIKLLK